MLSLGFCTRTWRAPVLWMLFCLTNISVFPLRAPEDSITSSATPYVALASLRAIILLIMPSACTLADFLLFLAHQTCWKLDWIAYLGDLEEESISSVFSWISHRLWCLHLVKIIEFNDLREIKILFSFGIIYS